MLATAAAVQRLELELGTLRGDDWQLQGGRLELDLGATADAEQAFRLRLKQFRHQGLPGSVSDLALRCDQGRVDADGIGCRRGTLDLHSDLLSARRAPITFDWRAVPSRLSLSLKKLGLAGGRLDLDLTDRAGGWRIDASGDGLELATLLAAAGHPRPLGEGGELAGRLAGTVSAAGSGSLQRAEWALRLRELAFSDPQGLYLGDGVALSLRGEAAGGGTEGSLHLALEHGALLTPFAYIAPERGTITLEGDFRRDGDRLRLSRLRYRDPGLLRLRGGLELDLAAGTAPAGGRLSIDWADAGRLFDAYLRPALGDPLYDGLTLGGRIRGRVDLGGAPRIGLALDRLDLELSGQLRLRGVEGRLEWPATGESSGNRLAWQGGRLLRVPFGASELALRIGPDAVALERPAVLPLWDGELHLEALSVAGLGGASPEGRLEGFLTPVSMERVSRSFGWPELAGKLSGMIPRVGYRDGTLAVEGTLLIRIFDGRILIRNLRLEDLFGPLPVLTADIQIRGLDLETLTRTFAFGKITGRLDGEIEGLRLEGWRPVAFDARLYTPAGDTTRHRISQKAVDNISNLGGAGLSGALSRSFLRVFEEFGYSRLGIRCRLRNGVCEMGGVGPARQGYYLVKGGGIPRIDIVGFNRQTDWNVLVAKLREITTSEMAPVVE